MYYRRGLARSLYELGTQVWAYRALKRKIDELDVERKENNSRIEAEKKVLQKRLDRIRNNISRFYFELGEPFFKKRTKSIFTRFGRVWSENEKELVFLKPRKEVIASIVATGRVEEFLSLQLKVGALKGDPTFARSVGLKVVEGPQVRISPPSGGDEDDS